MKAAVQFKNILSVTIAYLFILLFVYAAVSKLTDYQNFQLQVAQSPLLTAYAGFFARAVIVVEFAIAIALTIPSIRHIALLAAFTLMMLFTIYIFIILNYSPYVPCSCGGILEKMGWHEHLYFNIGFVVLGIIGVYLSGSSERYLFFVTIQLCVLGAASAIIMTVLFLFSENTLHHHNNFVRRIPPFAVNKSAELDLKYNTYYLAGTNAGKIYLGNYSTPSIVTVLDTALQNKRSYRITLDDTLNFKAVQIRVNAPYFYVYDGTVPCIYSGKTTDWHAKLRMRNVQRFSMIAPIDSATIAFRASTIAFGNLLGTFDLNSSRPVRYKHGLLQKQIDGFFDTDGTLQYSDKSKRFVYLYYYRNEFIVADSALSLINRGNTIDTTSKAKIKVEYLKKRKQTKFAAPPQMVNRSSALHENLLYVNSMLPGKYDPMVMWRTASIVDVYDINVRSYLVSFYVGNIDGKRMSNFLVNGTHLFALYENKIAVYRLDDIVKKEYDHNKKK